MYIPPFAPTPQPTLVAFLEALLERAREGEVQFLLCSAGVTPVDRPAGFEVKAHVALGDRVERWAPASRRAAYATVLEGLATGAQELDKNFKTLMPRSDLM